MSDTKDEYGFTSGSHTVASRTILMLEDSGEWRRSKGNGVWSAPMDLRDVVYMMDHGARVCGEWGNPHPDYLDRYPEQWKKPETDVRPS